MKAYSKKDRDYYNHPFVVQQSKDGKLLYDYLAITNGAPAGLYKKALKTIGDETGIDIEGLPELIKLLEPNVVWYPELNLFWAREFLNNQTTPKCRSFLIKVAEALKEIHQPEIVSEYLNFNKKKYGFEIPYEEGRQPSEPESETPEAKTALTTKQYGEFNNVFLTDEQYQKLMDRFGAAGVSERIENLSNGIERKGYKYKNHYAVILAWDRKDNKEKESGTHRRNHRTLPQHYTRPEDL